MNCDFDDTLFLRENSEKVIHHGITPEFQAGKFERQWFLHRDSTPAEDETQVMKYRADFAYSKADFDVALRLYMEVSKRPGISVQVAREVKESIVRCQIRLGRYEDALPVALDMNCCCKSDDHSTNTLMLLKKIYRGLDDQENEILVWQKLIEIHPLNPINWMGLAEAYATFCNIRKSSPTSVSSGSSGTPSIHCSQLESSVERCTIRYEIAACLIRIKVIVESTPKCVRENCLSKHSDLDNKATSWLNELNVSHTFLQAADKIIRNDVNQDETDIAIITDQSNMTTNEDVKQLDATQFCKKWFGWITNCTERNETLKS